MSTPLFKEFRTSYPWLAMGTIVRDGFGVWRITTCPSDDDEIGHAYIYVTETEVGVGGERHIWVNEFVRDFAPYGSA